MKYGIGLGVGVFLFFVVAIVASSFWQRVEPGYAGVIIDYAAGSSSGKPVLKSMPTGTYQFVNKFTQRITQQPVSQQTLVMVLNEHEGQVKGDDSVACNANDKSPLKVDVSVLWRVDPDKVGDLWLVRPNADINVLSNDVVRQRTRNAITDACGQVSFDEAYNNRAKFEEIASNSLGVSLTESYLVMDKLFVRGFHPATKEQQDGMTKIVNAQQAAAAAAYAKLEAQNTAAGVVAKAQGEADALVVNAKGRSEAVSMIGEQLKAYPEYTNYLNSQKWTGTLPLVVGSGNMPMITLPTAEPTKK